MLPGHWENIPRVSGERLGREAGPQRMMLEEGHLLIVLANFPNPANNRVRGFISGGNARGRMVSEQRWEA